MAATLIKGLDLTREQRAQVLAAFLYRWTSDNKRRAEVYKLCPVCNVAGGRADAPDQSYTAPVECRQHHPTVPLITDAEWLAQHAFYFTKAGRLAANRRFCEPAYLAD